MAASDYIPFASNVRYAKQLGEDVRAMREGRLGLSEAEKERMATAQKRDVGQQIGAMQQDIAQEALAAGGGGTPSGQYAKMMQSLAESSEEAGARGRRAAEEASMQLAEARRQETMDRLNQKRMENRSLIESTILKPALKPVGNALAGGIEQGLGSLFGGA